MKRFSKILCAVLVIAVLCTSLLFITTGAEEGTPTPVTNVSSLLAGYTASAPVAKGEGAKVIEAIKYPAEDNILNGASIDGTGGNSGKDTYPWSTVGGRGSDLITEPNGNVMHREYLFGPAMTDGEGYAKEGNDYVNYTFDKVDNTKVDGQNQYIVVDFDFAYEGTLDGVTFQVITRSSGAYWATATQLGKLGIHANTFAHITAVYNYQDGSSQIYVNGELVQDTVNGSLTSKGLEDREAGVTMGATEFRMGSNSISTFYLDNLYIRDVKVAEAEDQLAGKDVKAWSGYVYTEGYTMPTIPYFVPSYSIVDHKASDGTANSIVDNGREYFSADFPNGEKNFIAGVGTGNTGDSPFLTLAQGVTDDPFLIAYCNTTTSYKGGNNNLFINASGSASEPYDVIGDDLKAYYVIDFDIAAPGDQLPSFDISVIQRRVSDGAGYPFSDEIYFGEFYKGTDEWAHITIVGDIKNNEAKIFVNGVYAGNGGLAIRNQPNQSNWLADDTQVKAMGFRIELTRNNIQTDMNAGDAVAFDNLAERVYVNGNDALAAALADNNLTDWEGYVAGRTGEALPVIAKVNGVNYRNLGDLQAACKTNDKITVEFLAAPCVPVSFQANATIYTNGMPIESLVAFDESCYDIVNNDGVYTVKAPFVANLTQSKETINDKNAFIAEVKANISGNLLATRSNVVNYNIADSRAHYKLTNNVTGDSFILDTLYGEKMTNTNVYVGWCPETAIVYENGVNQHIIFDIDMAFSLFAQVNINPINRNSSNGGVWSNGSGYADQSFTAAGIPAGEFVHLTAVMSTDTKEMNIFINGKYVNTVANAINHADGAIKLDEIRMFSNAQAIAMYDNVAIRTTKSAELTAAVAAKDITQWSGNVYVEGYKLPEIPPIATVDGVEVYGEAALSAALTGEGTKNVVLLRPFTSVVPVGSNAVIETNGFAHGFDLSNAVVKTEGTKITVRVPNYILDSSLVVGTGSLTITSGHAFFDAVKYGAEDNLWKSLKYTNYNASTYRAAYLMTNTDSGDKYIYDTIFDTTTAGKNTYQDWNIEHSVGKAGKGYELGVDQYIVVDLDMAFDVYSSIELNFTTRNAAGSNIAGAKVEIGSAMQQAGIPAGEFAHITLLAEVDTNTVYIYVNGVKTLTVADGICNNSYTPIAEGYYLDGIRILQNKDTGIKFDNLYFRVFKDATLKGLDTLKNHSINIYTDSYDLPELPRLANVDGVNYYSSSTLNAALYGNFDAPKNVEFFHPTEAAINVNCDANINTNGFNVELNWYKNGTLIDNGDDTYSFDCGYISATRIENNTDYLVFTDAVKLNNADNKVNRIYFDSISTYMNTSWLDAEGKTVHGLNTYLVSTDGDDNVYAMLARPEGTTGMIGDYIYQKNDNGELVKGPQSGTYFNIEFTKDASEFVYSADENNYWVYDFDVLIEGEALNIYGYNLIKTAGGGFQYGGYNDTTALGYVSLEQGKGKFNHFTIVADYNNNAQYVFVNDTYIGTAVLMGNQSEPVAPDTAYIEGNTYFNNGYRVSLSNQNASDNASFAIDNILVRKFVSSNSDNLDAAMTAQDITQWSGRYNYTVPTTPALGIVNGDTYNNVADLEAAIAANENSTVEIIRPMRGTIALGGLATVESHNFAEIVSADIDGYFEFNAGGRVGVVKASRQYIVYKNGSVYTSEEISAENYASNSNLVTFYTTPGSTATKEVYVFVYGDQIVMPADVHTESDNPLAQIVWYLGDQRVEEFPVASAALGNVNYSCKEEIRHIDINTKAEVVVNTEFTVVIYVEVSDENGVVVGANQTVEIDGKTYIVFTKKLAANELNSEVVFDYIINYNHEGTYIQVNQAAKVTVAEYATKIFGGEYSLEDKNLMYAALAYSNAAYALLSGSANAEFTSLLEANVAFAPEAAELGEAADTSALRDVIRSAALKLDAAPVFVFKVAMGFNGTITFTYESEGVAVTVTKTVDATAGEQLVVVEGFKAYDIHHDITIEVTPVDGETVTGTYNLATYAQKTVAEDNTFATALLTYATVAEAHRTSVEPPHGHNFVDGKCECGEEDPNYVPPTGIQYTEITKDQVTSTTLTTVVESKIKQMDQGTEGTSNGYFTKEGGTAKYVLAMKDGAQVEGLYFSRSVPWAFLEGTVDRGTENSGYSEHRYALDKTTVITSISFDYIIDGTCGEHEENGEGIFQIRLADGTYVDTVYGNDTFVEDGQWHTFTWENTDSQLIDLFLFKLYAFQGEFVIANLVINYAA